MSKLIHYHYHRPGKESQVYQQWLVLDRPDVKILLTERYDGPPLEAEGRIMLAPGAPVVWFVFRGRWHDIGRFHLADGTFTGWYTNLCTPVEFAADAWSSTDLFLDLWMPQADDHVWLDQDEFESAIRTGLLQARLGDRARAEMLRIETLRAAGSWPPAVVREYKLPAVMSLKEARSEQESEDPQ